MATSVFGAAPTIGGAFSIDRTYVVLPPINGQEIGGIVQSVQSAFARPIQRMFDLSGKRRVYYIMGHAEGRLTIGRMAAPTIISAAMLNQFSDICASSNNNLTIETGPGYLDAASGNASCAHPTKPSSLTFKFCVLSAIQHSIAVGNVALNESLALEFAELDTN